jgi:hypothetical protein
MVYTYLVWCLLHSKRPTSTAYYQGFLAKNSNTSFYEEHHRVFALCLLEQVARSCREQTTDGFRPSEQRLEEAEQLFRECVENLAKKQEKVAEFLKV